MFKLRGGGGWDQAINKGNLSLFITSFDGCLDNSMAIGFDGLQLAFFRLYMVHSIFEK